MDMPNAAISPLPASHSNDKPAMKLPARLHAMYRWLGSLILSDDPKQRATISVLLYSVLFFSSLLYVLFYGQEQNIFDADRLKRVATVWLVYIGILYAVMRSGLNRHFADKTMAMFQVCTGQTFAVAVYGYAGAAHGGTLLTMALIMVFGMFNMKERASSIACLYSILLLGAMMIYKASTDPLQYPANIEWIYFTMSTMSLVLINRLSVRMCQMRLRLKHKTKALEMAYRQVQELSIRDELTGLPNRRNMKFLLEQHMELQARTGQNFYLAMLDLDHFKRINDTWGHHIGDEVLKSMARSTCNLLRKTDTIGRWGGEEFLLLLPETGKDQVPLGLSRLQLRVSGMPMSTNPPLFMTFSGGLTKYRSGECIEQTLRRVDELLYLAKSQGRNRIVHDDIH